MIEILVKKHFFTLKKLYCSYKTCQDNLKQKKTILINILMIIGLTEIKCFIIKAYTNDKT